MNILQSPRCRQTLLGLTFSPIYASKLFRTGNGGFYRPIGDEIPPHVRALMQSGCVVLEEFDFGCERPGDPATCRWVYRITDKGRMLVKFAPLKDNTP